MSSALWINKKEQQQKNAAEKERTFASSASYILSSLCPSDSLFSCLKREFIALEIEEIPCGKY